MLVQGSADLLVVSCCTNCIPLIRPSHAFRHAFAQLQRCWCGYVMVGSRGRPTTSTTCTCTCTCTCNMRRCMCSMCVCVCNICMHVHASIYVGRDRVPHACSCVPTALSALSACYRRRICAAGASPFSPRGLLTPRTGRTSGAGRCEPCRRRCACSQRCTRPAPCRPRSRP